MRIVVDKNVPLPSATIGSLRHTMDSMEVGDSFVYPISKRSSVTGTASAMNYRKAIKDQKKFITRIDTETTIRAWRTE